MIFLKNKNHFYYMKFYIEQSWESFFDENKELLQKIIKSINFKNNNILPDKKYIFRTFKFFPLQECKLVILGQDPYPGYTLQDNQKIFYAEGLSFSCNPNIKKLPASLKNIFKELQNNYPNFKYKNGSLLNWAKNEKIMLLNSSLTVIEGKPNSHSKKWEEFTNKVIQKLDEESNCLFLLMGNNAKKKMSYIKNKDRIITCVHPSPLSAYNGFFKSNIFIEINNKLEKKINWDL